MTKLDEQKALAIVFANTKRKKRTEDLVTVAEAFEYLTGFYGTQRQVAEKVALSQEMIREFLKILSLPKDIREMVRCRQIDRLDVAYRISMLSNKEEQVKAAREVTGLSSDDVRDVKRLVSTGAMSAEESKRMVLESKLKRLHIFIMDFSDPEYKEIISLARRKKANPAELTKQAVLAWVQRERRHQSGSGRE